MWAILVMGASCGPLRWRRMVTKMLVSARTELAGPGDGILYACTPLILYEEGSGPS